MIVALYTSHSTLECYHTTQAHYLCHVRVSYNISKYKELEAKAFSLLRQFGVPALSVAQKTKTKNITKYVWLGYILFCSLTGVLVVPFRGLNLWIGTT